MRFFLYLAPDYLDKFEILDVDEERQAQRLADHGADDDFLREAKPGDVQLLYKRDRIILRLGRCWDEGWLSENAGGSSEPGGEG